MMTASRLPRWPLAGLLVLSCVDWSGPNDTALSFATSVVDLGVARQVATSLTNVTEQAYGPIDLAATDVTDANDNPVPGAVIDIVPAQIATLNPGRSQNLTVAVSAPADLPDGQYRFSVTAAVPDVGTVASLDVRFDVDGMAATARVTSLSITGAPTTVRQGDVVSLGAIARDAGGSTVDDAIVTWGLAPAGAGYIDYQGTFVAYQTGTVTVTAGAGSGSASTPVSVAPRGLSRSFTTAGRGMVTDRFTSDLWVHGTTAFTGTWSLRAVGNQVNAGNTMYVWEVPASGTATLRDSVRVDARVVNDVKIRADGGLAVLTHEGSDDGLNGVTLLDMADPLHPTPITRFTSSLTTGVHNAWLDGDYLYLVVDGIAPTSGLRIVDVSDPAAPQPVASFYAGTSFLHDVFVRDGLAFLSHWDAGLVILDVGNGVEGGSPTNPVEVSRIVIPGGDTHNAWYWPSANYVFVGEEDFQTPGIMHVIDVSDLRQPREVATMTVPGTTPHNFWLDETNGTLYLAWYANGVRAVDVSGRLAGRLERQGREYAGLQYAGTGAGCSGPTNTHTCNWAPQIHNGLLYLSDMNTGLWVLRPS